MIRVHGVPLYWGFETEPLDRSFATKATLHEVLPPYRLSTRAWRLRVSPWHWLHFGTFRYDDAVGRYGLDADPNQISEWRGPTSNGQVGSDEDDEAEAGAEGAL
jgi:hypothetical protein